ncbi:hypothetical protein [Endozoicomonas sp. 4G]|uniref:hypothetical protein n=1 Tax=Endozoicomonas sp. 4G TaxID=2872754 RepID=UPI0020789BE2|nr:hypothetical protein [Endozoicomonas sp. 4G]
MNSFVFKKERISSIQTKGLKKNDSCEVEITQSIVTEDLIFQNYTFKSLKFKSSNLKGNISFINCTFDNISFLDTKSSSNITFSDCTVYKNVNIYNCTINGSIRVLKSIIKGMYSINNTTTNSVELDITSAEKIQVSSDESSSVIKKILFNKVKSNSLISITALSGTEEFRLESSSSPSFFLEKLNTKESSTININDCKFDLFQIDRNRFGLNSILIVSDATLLDARLFKNTYKNSQVKILNSIVTGILYIDSLENDDKYTIDFSTSSITNLKLDERLVSSISKGIGLSPLLNQEGNIEQRVSTLRILKSSFANDHAYHSEDNCFYILKNEESKILISSSNSLVKPIKILSYILNRFVFGWGVRVKNPILSSAAFILVMTGVYYIYFHIKSVSSNLEYMGYDTAGFFSCLLLSILAFFGQQADANLSADAPVFLLIIQFIIGMILTTTFVGIIIRKLVR